MQKSSTRTPTLFPITGSTAVNPSVQCDGPINGKIKRTRLDTPKINPRLDTPKSNSRLVHSKAVSSSHKHLPPRDHTPAKKAISLKRSQSIPSLLAREATFKSGENIKLKKTTYSPMSGRHTGDKAVPLTQFCTPNRSLDHNRSIPRHLLSSSGSSSKCTLNKRFHSEANILEPSATPDYFNKVQFDTPQRKIDGVGNPSEETSNLTVAVRVRPFSLKELNDYTAANVVAIEGNEVKVTCETGTIHSFPYDYCFSCDPQNSQYANQDALFTTLVHPLVDTVFEGYNACLFAYGQTGSGKSYSMMGIDIDTGSCIGHEAGVIPRFCFELFERIDSLDDTKIKGIGISSHKSCTATVEISYFEIYNEKIHDLLGGTSEAGKRAPLKVREHPEFGPYVVDLSRHSVNSYEDLQGWLTIGNSQRATAATGMNEKSSRSHSIFSIVLTQTRGTYDGADMLQESSTLSKINLVDLAGSERISQTCASGERLREGVSINRSLLTLGKVIAALSESMNGKKHGYVPYRDSVLTWLLRESLGGNSRTTMLATVSPSSLHIDETLATLRYACQARRIVNRVRVNENPQDRIIRELRKEVERLRSLREEVERQQGRSASPLMSAAKDLSSREQTLQEDEEITKLKLQLKQSEEKLEKEQRSWSERVAESQKHKCDEMKYLRRCGIALQLEWTKQQPCLVNLAADPMISGTLLYLLPPGTICIGRSLLEGEVGHLQEPDVALNGPLVHKDHCKIKNDGSKLCLCPGPEGETFVNGQAITFETVLHHGDRLVIGGNHYFRVSSPYDCTDPNKITQHADYEYAHKELLQIQEDKLKAELEDAKYHAIQELEEAKNEAERRLSLQRSAYEDKLKQLGATLGDEKNALAEAQRSTEVMEEQIRKLRAEIDYHKCRSSILEDFEPIDVSPYRSNFLQEVEEIMNETAFGAEGVLEMSSSETSSPSGVSLHEMQVMVREATLRCRDLDIHWEFSQQHDVGESGLIPVVRVRNPKKGVFSLWTPSQFISWLDRLRDFEPNYDSVNELLAVNVIWEDDIEGRGVSEGPGSRRITVNTKTIKQQLNNSLNQLSSSLNESMCSVGPYYGNITADNSTSIFQRDELNCYVEEIEEATTKLRNVCDDKGEVVLQALDSIFDSIEHLRMALHLDKENLPNNSTSHVYNSSSSSSDNCAGEVAAKVSATPKKSNLRSDFSLKSPKAVRFLLSDHNHTNSP